MTLRIIVTGNREWNDVATVREVLSCFPRGTIVVHGAASGAIRNREMIELGANGIIAFGDLFDGTKRRGTGDCLFEALRKSIPGLVVPYGVKVAALRPLVQGLLFGGVRWL